MEEGSFIGDRLRKARIKKGYTLDELQQKTKIQKRYLIAIEENNFDELPGDFFVRAFIRQYADVIEFPLVDDNEFLTDPKSDLTQEPSKHVPSRTELRRSSNETKFRYGSSSQGGLPTFLVVLFFILLLGIIWFYLNFMRNNQVAQNTNDNQSQTVEVSSVSETQLEESATEPSNEQPEERINVGEASDGLVNYTVHGLTLPETLTLDVDATGRSWMQVLLDGEDAFNGTLEAGMSQEIEIPTGTEEISIRVGYIPATTIIFGENLIVPNPDNGEIVQTQTFVFEMES